MSKVKYIVNALIRKGYWFNNIQFAECRKFRNYGTFNTKVVNLGSTSALHAFNYEGLGIKGANWALGHNPLSGDLAILKNYVSFLDSKNSTVIIPLCPFSSLSGGYLPFEERYYAILYPSTISSYSYSHDIQVQEKWNNPIWSYPFWGFYLDMKHLLFKVRNKELTEKEMQDSANQMLSSWYHEFSLNDFSTPLSLVNKYNMKEAALILDEIIEFCNKRNIKPVVVIPPMYKSLGEKFSGDGYNILIEGLLKQIGNSNYRFISYINDSEFINDRTLYLNSFLMNKKGSKLFTKRILTDIGVL